ncbi:hypothetical protein IJH24_00435 [Candidatus Saccharibacteria bacterium]|nr:hypothetical protein [Candidatus Saccharibacteria bacterium]
MDKLIKQSIDSRRDAIKNSFEVDAGAQKKIDALFDEIKKLGEKCKDAGEFETEFAKSPLNQKYLDLFTEIATSSAMKTAVKGAAIGALESAAENAIRKVVPTRAAVNQKATDALRSVPGVGDAIDIGQKASYLGHLGNRLKR